MSSLERALDRLLHDASALSAFAAGEHAGLGLSADELAELAALDPTELAGIAAKIRDELRERRHVGSGGLLEAYPRTLAAYRAARPDDAGLDELLARFTASPSFAEYREIPFAGRGRSLEESFFLFSEAADIGAPEPREAEFLQAIIRALAVNPRPSFSIPRCVKVRTNAYIAATRRGTPPWLFAALIVPRGRVVTGPITPFLRDLLLSNAPPVERSAEGGRREYMEVAARHGVGEATLEEALSLLHELGF